MEALNPSNRTSSPDRKRIPMSVPVQKLAVPDIPGYHLHWFNSDPGRIARAQLGGYEFVKDEEMEVNDRGIGGTSTRTGNTDMGSNVSIVAGKEMVNGQPARLILMKIRQELFEEDQLLQEKQHDRVRSALLGGIVDAGQGGDASNRYVDKARTNIPDFFKKKPVRVS